MVHPSGAFSRLRVILSGMYRPGQHGTVPRCNPWEVGLCQEVWWPGNSR